MSSPTMLSEGELARPRNGSHERPSWRQKLSHWAGAIEKVEPNRLASDACSPRLEE